MDQDQPAAGTTGERTADDRRPPGPRGFALAAVLASLMMTMLLQALFQTILSTALPRIIQSLHGLDRFTWVMTAYLLGTTAVVPIAGKLFDQFGRKRFLLASVTIFLLGTLAGGLADDMDMLIVARAVQGIGGGMGMALVVIVLGDLFSRQERGRWQGLFGGVFGLASIIGPTLGGWLTDHGPLIDGLVDEGTRWRWIFFVMVPLALLTLVGLIVYLPPIRGSAGGNHRGWNAIRRIDFLGAGLSVAGTICLLLGLTWGGQIDHGWTATEVVALLAAAIVLIGLFLWAETRAVEPILPLDLFRNSIYAADAVVALGIGVAMMSVVTYMPIFLQNVAGMTATYAGATITPMTLSFIVGATICGFVVSRIGRYRILAVGGSVLLVVGGLLLSRMTPQTSAAVAIRDMVITGIGVGTFFPLVTLIAQNILPHALLGVGTATITYFRSLGQVLGVAIVGTIVSHSLANRLSGAVPANLRGLPAEPLGWAIVDGFGLVVLVGLAVLAASFLLKDVPLAGRQPASKRADALTAGD
ncbi:MAG: MFS transporter [Alphaproteobacteria bacterium]|nr:MFS transporter [Alphaproteobacteria bacterium]